MFSERAQKLTGTPTCGLRALMYQRTLFSVFSKFSGVFRQTTKKKLVSDFVSGMFKKILRRISQKSSHNKKTRRKYGGKKGSFFGGFLRLKIISRAGRWKNWTEGWARRVSSTVCGRTWSNWAVFQKLRWIKVLKNVLVKKKCALLLGEASKLATRWKLAS